MKLCLAIIIVSAWAGEAVAQSMQVIGGNSYARECFQLSSSASLSGSAGRTDVEVCDKALAHGGLKRKDLVATYVNRGVLKVAIEDFVGAAQDYNRAIELSGDTAEAYINRGNLWFVSGRYAEAIADYDKSLELGLYQAHVALLNKGMALESLGNLTEAKEAYSAALERNPEWTQASSRLARVNRKLDRAQGRNEKQAE